MKETLLLSLITFLFSQFGFSQQFQTIRANPDSSMLILEIGARLQLTSTGILVDGMMPIPNIQKTDLAKGDKIFGLNGKRYTTIPELRDAYKAIAKDEEVKLGVEKDGSKRIVRFKKAESMGGGMQIMMDTDSDNPNESNAFVPAGLLGEFSKDGFIIQQILPFADESLKKSVKEDDVIVELNGKSVKDEAQVRTLLEGVKPGDTFTLKIKIDGKVMEFSPKKMQARMMINRN